MTFLKKLIILYAVLSAITGCAPKIISLPNDWSNRISTINSHNLWSIQIKQGGEEKFSGILVLKQNTDGIVLILLDPTGIKILEENITENGEISIVSSINMIKRSRLPKYLGNVINQIFYLNPNSETCDNMIVRLCWSNSDRGSISKESKFGPFSNWTVIYLEDANNTYSVRIEHRSPWADTRLFMQMLQDA